jgi:hypothetical protein
MAAEPSHLEGVDYELTPHHVEQKLLLLEHFLNRAATDLFDDRSTEEEFKNSVERLSKALIDYRPQLMR